MGTTEALFRFERITEKFTRFKLSPNAAFSDRNISAISEDSDGMMWTGSIDGGLCRFDRPKGIFFAGEISYKGCKVVQKRLPINRDKSERQWQWHSPESIG